MAKLPADRWARWAPPVRDSAIQAFFWLFFRVRRYQPYESMEVTFGWSASAIGLWCDMVLSIMDEKYQSFRAFPGNFIIIIRSFVLQDNTLPCEIMHAWFTVWLFPRVDLFICAYELIFSVMFLRPCRAKEYLLAIPRGVQPGTES